jgi:hypothetical protein
LEQGRFRPFLSRRCHSQAFRHIDTKWQLSVAPQRYLGGFSTKNDGIAAYNSPYIKLVLTLFMFVGGVSFGLIISSLRDSWRVFWKNDVFRAYVYIIAVFFVLYFPFFGFASA